MPKGIFLNKYLELNIKPDQIYFKRIWIDAKSKDIRHDIQSRNNLPLRGLYFLSKEFFDDDPDYILTTDPDSKRFRDIRNHIEHKYIKIQWVQDLNKEDDLFFDNFAFKISESEMISKTLRLTKMTREAIIYLSLAVHVEEQRFYKEDELVGPLFLSKVD